MLSLNRPHKKVLPIKIPVNTTWTWNTNLMAVLENNSVTEAWSYSNYIQLYCNVDQVTGKVFMDFLHLYDTFLDCPWITVQTFTREFINNMFGNIQEFFINCIANGNYIFGIFDENCFLHNIHFQTKLLHELFIFGYDCRRKMFDVADFTFTGKYSFLKVSYKDIVNAYKNVKPDDTAYGVRFMIVHFNENGSYNLDKVLIKQNLQNYLNSAMPYEYTRINCNPKPQLVYGMDIYDCLAEQLQKSLSITEEIDIRPFHMIYIHKVIMVNRIKYMIENGYLYSEFEFVQDFEQIQNTALTIRNKYLKYSMNKKYDFIEEIIQSINEIKINEAELIQKLLFSI